LSLDHLIPGSLEPTKPTNLPAAKITGVELSSISNEEPSDALAYVADTEAVSADEETTASHPEIEECELGEFLLDAFEEFDPLEIEGSEMVPV
jgi:hypothetical protein